MHQLQETDRHIVQGLLESRIDTADHLRLVRSGRRSVHRAGVAPRDHGLRPSPSGGVLARPVQPCTALRSESGGRRGEGGTDDGGGGGRRRARRTTTTTIAACRRLRRGG